MAIRPYASPDLTTLYAINQAARPGVSHLADPAALQALIAPGTCLVATDEADRPLGFVNLIEPGTEAYPSANLRWLERWGDERGVDMLYVDRIAVAEAARGAGLGRALYAAAFAAAAGRGKLTCEINIEPDNPGSHRFHARLGFVRVGELWHRADYAVAFYARDV